MPVSRLPFGRTESSEEGKEESRNKGVQLTRFRYLYEGVYDNDIHSLPLLTHCINARLQRRSVCLREEVLLRGSPGKCSILEMHH